MDINDKQWNDISAEVERHYYYPDGSEVVVEEPRLLNIQPSSQGGHAHRIQTKDGVGIYIRPGWNAIAWIVSEGNAIFKF